MYTQHINSKTICCCSITITIDATTNITNYSEKLTHSQKKLDRNILVVVQSWNNCIYADGVHLLLNSSSYTNQEHNALIVLRPLLSLRVHIFCQPLWTSLWWWGLSALFKKTIIAVVIIKQLLKNICLNMNFHKVLYFAFIVYFLFLNHRICKYFNEVCNVQMCLCTCIHNDNIYWYVVTEETKTKIFVLVMFF